jgi:hypothetical protein
MNIIKLFGISLIVYQIFLLLLAQFNIAIFFIKFIVINIDPILILIGLLMGIFLLNNKKESLILPVVISLAFSFLFSLIIDSYNREKILSFFLRVDAILIWTYLGYFFKEFYKKKKNKK